MQILAKSYSCEQFLPLLCLIFYIVLHGDKSRALFATLSKKHVHITGTFSWDSEVQIAHGRLYPLSLISYADTNVCQLIC